MPPSRKSIPQLRAMRRVEGLSHRSPVLRVQSPVVNSARSRCTVAAASFTALRAPSGGAGRLPCAEEPGSGARRCSMLQCGRTLWAGWDLQTLDLRYLAEMPEVGLSTGFRQRQGNILRGFFRAAGGDEAIEIASDSFFVSLARPESDFWVNLNESEPDRIMDLEMCTGTRIGRAMPGGRPGDEAALVGSLIDPRTARGKEYWAGARRKLFLLQGLDRAGAGRGIRTGRCPLHRRRTVAGADRGGSGRGGRGGIGLQPHARPDGAQRGPGAGGW